MGAALYIVTEREIPGFDAFVNGKALSRVEPQLASIAILLGVTPLMEFFSASEEDALALMEAERTDPEDVDPPQTAWFGADAGLATVNALDRHLASAPDAIPSSSQVRQTLMSSQPYYHD